MKSKLAIIACLFGLLVLACGDKGTDPPPVIKDYKQADINVLVLDGNSNPASGVATFCKYRFPGSDTIWVWDVAFSNEFGRCFFEIRVNSEQGKDSAWIYAMTADALYYTDTITVRVDMDGQTINLELQFSTE